MPRRSARSRARAAGYPRVPRQPATRRTRRFGAVARALGRQVAFEGPMAALAWSWEAKTSSPERVASALSQAVAQVRNPSGGLVFAGGALAASVSAIAAAIAARCPAIPVAVAGGGGVMTERGEIEDQPAATGIVWSGGRTELVSLLQD